MVGKHWKGDEEERPLEVRRVGGGDGEGLYENGNRERNNRDLRRSARDDIVLFSSAFVCMQ
mgnify:CR=1 FL=1